MKSKSLNLYHKSRRKNHKPWWENQKPCSTNYKSSSKNKWPCPKNKLKKKKLIIENQKLMLENQHLRSLVNIDELTKISNRRHFDECLNSEWCRMCRESGPLSLILLDIDYFKRYNDTYGHLKGDSCLYEVAQAIRNCLKRPADIVARYGGEEFAVILPKTEYDGAMKMGEKIRQAIEDLAIEHINSEGRLKIVTVSLGVGSIVPNLESQLTNLIQVADKALYNSKRQGRNIVTGKLITN